jgi:oligopeptide/dipeptide ABC transporter ATP-binding protein
MTSLLSVDGLYVTYRTDRGMVPVVRDVSFHVDQGEILGIVGESGCGKSTLALALIRLLPDTAAITSGAIRLDGVDLASLDHRRLRELRGRRLAMIFQDPLTALNPTLRIGTQMGDALRAHHPSMSRAERRRRAAETLRQVHLPDAEDRLNHLPHEFSGGMRQRIAIAMALSLTPDLLIADEPTSSLDVTLEQQILSLFREARDRWGTAVLMVSHDLEVVAGLCDRVIVMYAGQIVEHGPAEVLGDRGRHPYTRALVGARPDPSRRGEPLLTIPGRVPDPGSLPEGCVFERRCPHGQAVCRSVEPTLVDDVRCHAYARTPGYDASWVAEAAR